MNTDTAATGNGSREDWLIIPDVAGRDIAVRPRTPGNGLGDDVPTPPAAQGSSRDTPDEPSAAASYPPPRFGSCPRPLSP